MSNSDLITDADDRSSTAAPAADGGYNESPGVLSRLFDRGLRGSDGTAHPGVHEQESTTNGGSDDVPAIVIWHDMLAGVEGSSGSETAES